jgi:site-specific recombinase XerC
MIEDMTVRNLSPATQRSYVSAVAKVSRHFGCSPGSPDRLDLEDVRAFQAHLVSTGISWPALNQIVCALRFFYGVTLGQATIPERIPYAREPRKLPVVLSADGVVAILGGDCQGRELLIIAHEAAVFLRSRRRSVHPRHHGRSRNPHPPLDVTPENLLSETLARRPYRDPKA